MEDLSDKKKGRHFKISTTPSVKNNSAKNYIYKKSAKTIYQSSKKIRIWQAIPSIWWVAR